MKKGNLWHFGYKAHISVDRETGLVCYVKVTGVNVHDVTVVPALRTGDETEIDGDGGDLGADKRECAITSIWYKINRRPYQSKDCTMDAKNVRNHPFVERLSMSLAL